MPETIFTIFPNGKVEVEGIGFSGKACLDKTKDIINSIGEVQKSEIKTGAHGDGDGGVSILTS